MPVEIELVGGKELMAKIDRLRGQSDKEFDEALGRGAEIVAQNARYMCPIAFGFADTGLLLSTIRVEHPDILHYDIIAGGGKCDFAKYVEYGFRHVGSGKFVINSFMRPALIDSISDILNLLKGTFELK